MTTREKLSNDITTLARFLRTYENRENVDELRKMFNEICPNELTDNQILDYVLIAECSANDYLEENPEREHRSYTSANDYMAYYIAISLIEDYIYKGVNKNG